MGNGIIKNLKFIWNCILQVIYPSYENCILCDDDTEDDKIICTNCQKSIKLCNGIFVVEHDNVSFDYYSAAYYVGTMMELILKLKYKSNFSAGDVIAEQMINLIKRENIQFDVIAYVPITQDSMKSRGYNQSQYLARVIGNEMNIPVTHCLDKTKQTKDQIGLSSTERWSNVLGSFRILDETSIRNKKILLIDDVITTGATAFSCAYELMKCEVKKIIILTGAKSRV
jgi:competence protein ComFC